MRFQHEIKSARLGEFLTAAGRTLAADLIGTETFLAFFAIDDLVGKIIRVARGLPYHRMHENTRIQAHHIIAAVHNGFPPGVLDVALQFHAEWAVIPGTGETTVYFGRLKDETAPFAQRGDFFHVDRCLHQNSTTPKNSSHGVRITLLVSL